MRLLLALLNWIKYHMRGGEELVGWIGRTAFFSFQLNQSFCYCFFFLNKAATIPNLKSEGLAMMTSASNNFMK